MKKSVSAFLCILAITTIFISCKKELPAGSPDSFFKAKYNGVEKEFSTRSYASKSDLGGIFTLSIVGSNGNETNSISLWSEKDSFVSGKVYGSGAIRRGTNNSYGYSSNERSNDPTTCWTSTCIFGEVPERFECKLTEVTSTYVKGSFTADLYKNESGEPQRIVVSDGEFYVRFQ